MPEAQAAQWVRWGPRTESLMLSALVAVFGMVMATAKGLARDGACRRRSVESSSSRAPGSASAMAPRRPRSSRSDSFGRVSAWCRVLRSAELMPPMPVPRETPIRSGATRHLPASAKVLRFSSRDSRAMPAASSAWKAATIASSAVRSFCNLSMRPRPQASQSGSGSGDQSREVKSA